MATRSRQAKPAQSPAKAIAPADHDVPATEATASPPIESQAQAQPPIATQSQVQTDAQDHADLAPSDSQPSDQPAAEPMFRDDRIRLAAYRRFLERGDGSGDEVTDWLEAEAEIDSEDAAASDDEREEEDAGRWSDA